MEPYADGLAALAAPGLFQVFTLPQSVTELVVVADSFLMRPLRRFLQSTDRYQVLALSLDNVRFFEGNRHSLDEVDLVPKVPRTITAALGAGLTENPTRPSLPTAASVGEAIEGTTVTVGKRTSSGEGIGSAAW